MIFPSNISLPKLSTQIISFAPLSIDSIEASFFCLKCAIYISATSDIIFKCPNYRTRTLAENVTCTFTIKPSLEDIAWFTMFQRQIEHYFGMIWYVQYLRHKYRINFFWSNLLDQINLIMYTVNFDKLLFYQISLTKFFLKKTCASLSNSFVEK